MQREDSVKTEPRRGKLPPMKATLPVLAFAMSLSLFAADPPAELTNSIGMKLVRIAPGEFTMGAGTEPPTSIELWSKRDYDESPAHKVRITRPFLMGATGSTRGFAAGTG
jgi:formylglycine-generating enzyme required for sulfatase activity